jgi:hypothetical protein
MRRCNPAPRKKKPRSGKKTGSGNWLNKPETLFTLVGGALLLYLLYDNADAIAAWRTEGAQKYQEYQKNPT